MHNPLWEFSLALYARPGVAAACVAAQDRCAADVNLLLYAAWLQQQRLALAQSQWRQLEESVASWRHRVVQPLRALRRDWQDLPAAGTLREQVKLLELAAEREQQAQMFAWHRLQTPQRAREGSLEQALALLLQAPSARAEDPGCGALLERLLELLT